MRCEKNHVEILLANIRLTTEQVIQITLIFIASQKKEKNKKKIINPHTQLTEKNTTHQNCARQAEKIYNKSIFSRPLPVIYCRSLLRFSPLSHRHIPLYIFRFDRKNRPIRKRPTRNCEKKEKKKNRNEADEREKDRKKVQSSLCCYLCLTLSFCKEEFSIWKGTRRSHRENYFQFSLYTFVTSLR